MIERSLDGEFEITCDFCGDAEGLGEHDFYDAADEAKSRGWRAFKEKDEWRNKCPDCIEKGVR